MEFLSDQIEEISGYPASDFVGNPVRSFEIAEISGYPASNSFGKSVRTFASIIHRDDLGMVGASLMENVARGEVFDLKYRVRHADGSIRWVQDRGQGISGEDGRLSGWTARYSTSPPRRRVKRIASASFARNAPHAWRPRTQDCSSQIRTSG